MPPLAVAFPLVGTGAPGAEDDFVARLRAGDLAALGEAYDAHHVHVRAFAARLVGDAAAAEDLVQETFLTLPRAVARFRGESSLRTFLVAIAVRHAGHHVRWPRAAAPPWRAWVESLWRPCRHPRTTRAARALPLR